MFLLVCSALFLLVGAPAQGQSVCDAQCRAAQLAALERLYITTGGPHWTPPSNLTRGRLGLPWAFGATSTFSTQNLSALPDYCQWMGIACCQLDNTVDLTTFLAGAEDSLTANCSAAGGVSGISLAYRNLTGTVPTLWSPFAPSLQHLALSGATQLAVEPRCRLVRDP